MSTHRVQATDRARIRCACDCDKPADICEHMHWDTGNTRGVSFWYYTDKCFTRQLWLRAVR